MIRYFWASHFQNLSMEAEEQIVIGEVGVSGSWSCGSMEGGGARLVGNGQEFSKGAGDRPFSFLIDLCK